MKPFNLQEALAGKPVVTRDGRKVQRVAHLPEICNAYKVVAVINGEFTRHIEAGHFWNDRHEHHCDLFMASEKKRGWVNVYRRWDSIGSGRRCERVYDTRKEAEQEAEDSIVATVPIEWEE